MSAYQHKIVPGYDDLNDRTMARLGTLLHELIQVYLQLYACWRFPSYQEDVGQSGGHRRAWHQIAGSIEHSTAYRNGLPLDLSRFSTLTLDPSWKGMKYSPTQKEVKEQELVEKYTE
jgi:hypothetical protein